MKLTEQTQAKLEVLVDVVKYLEKTMYRDGVSNEEWNACFDVKMDIKDKIFAELRISSMDETLK